MSKPKLREYRGGAQYNEFYRNVVRNTSVPCQIAGDHNSVFYNIIDTVRNSGYVDHPTGCGINLNGGWTKSQVGHDNSILNNVIYNCEEAGIDLQCNKISPDLYNISIKNNIIVECGTHSLMGYDGVAVLFWNKSHIRNLTFENNIIYSTITDGVVRYRGVNMDVEAFQATAENGTYADNIQSSPLLVDTSRGNFRLAFDSPAIDAGIYVGIEEDMDGTAVPCHGYVDIGAYEFC